MLIMLNGEWSFLSYNMLCCFLNCFVKQKNNSFVFNDLERKNMFIYANDPERIKNQINELRCKLDDLSAEAE